MLLYMLAVRQMFMGVQMQGPGSVPTSEPPKSDPRLMLDLIRIFSFLADCSKETSVSVLEDWSYSRLGGEELLIFHRHMISVRGRYASQSEAHRRAHD